VKLRRTIDLRRFEKSIAPWQYLKRMKQETKDLNHNPEDGDSAEKQPRNKESFDHLEDPHLIAHLETKPPTLDGYPIN
jgi:hypothetical protein